MRLTRHGQKGVFAGWRNMMKASYRVLCMALLSVAGLVSGCESPVNEWCADVNPRGWSSRDAAVVGFDNQDTVSFRNVVLFLRYDAEKVPGSLELDIETMAPDSTLARERFAMDMVVNRAGGASFPSYYESVYRSRVVFSQKGRYEVRITPQEDGVKGIVCVGIAIR